MIHLATTSHMLPDVGIGDVRLHTLQFADDLILFLDGSSMSTAAIKIILDTFSDYSGLKINYTKSSISPINLPSDLANTLAHSFWLFCERLSNNLPGATSLSKEIMQSWLHVDYWKDW